MIRVYLDNTLVSNPDNWDELLTVLKRDDGYNGLLLYQENTLQFTKDGYEYLYGKLINEGYCTVIECKIDYTCDDGINWKLLLSGQIFVSDIEFNEKECYAQAKIEDNSFFAMIKNNMSIRVSPMTLKTKNQLDIPRFMTGISNAATNDIVVLVDFYNLTLSTKIKNEVWCFTVFDVFKRFISFMTDNKIKFASNAFSTGAYKNLTITRGKHIRCGFYGCTASDYGIFPLTSFKEFFKEVQNVTEPLLMIIEDPYGSPTVRIEPKSDTYDDAIIIELNDIDEIKTSVYNDILYTNIKLGSSITRDSGGYPEQADVFTYKEEQYYFLGKCNIDNDLDIQGNYIRSSNVIEFVLANVSGSDTHDDDIFFIQIDDIQWGPIYRTANALQIDVFNINRFFYNPYLRNIDIVTRYEGGLPNSVAYLTGEQENARFLSYKGPLQDLTAGLLDNQVFYTNEQYDNGGNYNTANSRYTAPQAMLVKLTAQLVLELPTWLPLQYGDEWIDLQIWIYDSGANIKQITTVASLWMAIYTWQTTPSLQKALGGSATFNMNAGDYAIVNLYVRDGAEYASIPLVAGYFEASDNTLGGGGIVQTVDIDDFPILLHEFEYPLSIDNFNLLVNNSQKRIKFKMDNQQERYAWIKEIKYQPIKKNAKISLFTSRK